MARFRLPFLFKSSRHHLKNMGYPFFKTSPRELRSGQKDSPEDDVEFIPTRPLHPRPPQPQPVKPPRPWGRWLQTAGIGISIPVSIVAIANLPIQQIRRPVAKTAPILLLPSYFTIERNFNDAIATTTTAQNQLNNATTPQELEPVRQNFVAARDRLESLPLDFLETVPRCNFGWYRCQYSLNRYQQTQNQLDTIETALAQEKQAQLALTNAEQNLKTGKWDYLQAYTNTDRTAAIATWQTALDRIAQVSPQTLAGNLAQAKLTHYEEEFQQTVGEQLDPASQGQRTVALIESARQFAWQAALASQNPPHTVSEWQHVENLWGQAIRSLKRVSSLDLDRYNQAQRLLAQYNAYQGQIRIRREAEQAALNTLETAQNQVEDFLAHRLQDTQAQAQLQGIRYELNKIPPGTTVYPQAQEMQDWVQQQLEGVGSGQ